MTDRNVCSKCDAPIVWAATVNGKCQPLDAEPNPEGNLRLTDEYVATSMGALQRVLVIPKGDQLGLLDDDNEPRWMPHHATCPNADDFRKPKRPA